MEKQFVTTSESPKVILESHADLHLKGSDELQVVAKTDSDNNLSIEQQEDAIRVRCYSECKVTVPRGAIVVIEAASSNAAVKGLEGELTVQDVNGNLVVHGTGPTQIQRVHGDLVVKNVDGDLIIQTVDGNATAKDIQGDFTVREVVRGNLVLSDVSGNASAKVDGNITVSLDPAPGESYDFTAHGNLMCNLPEDASVAVHIARAAQVTVKLPGVDRVETGDEPIEFDLGDGDATLKLSTDGNIFIGNQAPGWEAMGHFDFGRKFDGIGEQFEGMFDTFGEQMSQQIDAQMEMVESQIDAQLANLTARLGSIGMTPEQGQRMAERAREASARTTERAQERMRRAQEKLDRKMAEAQRRAEQRARDAERRTRVHERHAGAKEHRGFQFNWPSPPVPPTPPVPPSDPVSDDERMVILRMLEQKKITPEQAEQLLSALEGKGA